LGGAIFPSIRQTYKASKGEKKHGGEGFIASLAEVKERINIERDIGEGLKGGIGGEQDLLNGAGRAEYTNITFISSIGK